MECFIEDHKIYAKIDSVLCVTEADAYFKQDHKVGECRRAIIIRCYSSYVPASACQQKAGKDKRRHSYYFDVVTATSRPVRVFNIHLSSYQ